MSGQHWHKRYHSNALTGFMALTLEERGAYQTLLDMIYDRGGPLIDNERLLAGYMGVSIRKWRALREILIEKDKIRINPDGLITNDRAEKEIENATKTHRKLIESGSKGGRVRAENEKNGNEINENVQASLEPALSDPQAILEARSKIEKKTKAKKDHPLPEGWTPEPFALGTKSRAIVDEWPKHVLESQIEKFTAYHLGHASRWSDWQQAWRTWVINAQAFAAERPVANDAPKTMLEQIQLEQKWKRQAGGIA